MSNEQEITYDPNSLRNTIRIALGDKWTHELEEALFWPISMFCSAGCERTRNELLAQIHKALGLMK